MSQKCDAGRGCGYGGRWKMPCPHEAMHAIASPSMPPIHLCEEHFREVAAAGLVADQNITKEEFDLRRNQSAG